MSDTKRAKNIQNENHPEPCLYAAWENFNIIMAGDAQVSPFTRTRAITILNFETPWEIYGLMQDYSISSLLVTKIQ